jgi:tripartite-type tricarboxylate transporter receptor subunit TctC
MLRDPADGYSLMLSGVNSVVTNLLALPNAGYDPFKDIQLLTVLVSTPLVLVVSADSPIRTFEDFLKAARAKPGSLSYGSWGVGSSLQLTTETLADLAGIEVNHVPYKGSAPALVDLISGRLDFMLDLPQSSLPFLRSGKLRALGVSSTAVTPLLPNVEPISTWVPGYSFYNWNGIYARSGIPDEAKVKLQAAMAKALTEPETAKRITDSGNFPQPPLTDAQITQMLRAEDKRLREIVAKRKIQFN